MPSDLLSKWLIHFDPLHRGWRPAGIANGVCATNGFFFPRVRGGYVLRRSVDGASWAIVGAGAAGATTLREFPWVAHAAGTTYAYRLNAIGAGGVEEDSADNVATVVFDAQGAWVGSRPSAPTSVRVRPASGGRFELQWTYAESGEPGAAPAAFGVFHDGGTGTIDYETAAAVVAYRPRQVHFRYLSAAFDHGTKVRWTVRAVSETGVDDGNTAEVFAWADTEGPKAPAAIATHRGEESRL